MTYGVPKHVLPSFHPSLRIGFQWFKNGRTRDLLRHAMMVLVGTLIEQAQAESDASWPDGCTTFRTAYKPMEDD